MTPEVTAAVAVLALVLTSPGATVAAGIVNRLVEWTKSLNTAWASGRERFWAIGYTVLLVAIAYVVGLGTIPPTQKPPWVDPLAFLIGLPLTIYNIARLAMSMADDLDRTPNSIAPKTT